jgi:uncharacterized membrane protein YoaK (UPF0700 family)
VGVALAWIAGGVDAIGYLGLSHLFTAHLSGNSAAFGAAFGKAQWQEAGRRVFPIPLFVGGVVIGALGVEIALQRKVKSPLMPALLLEEALLLICLLWGRDQPKLPLDTVSYFGFISLLALAMGMQNATLRRVGRTGVRTTYVTGMLTEMAEALVTWGFWLRKRTCGRSVRHFWRALRVSFRRDSARNAGLFGSIWLAFVFGAIGGSVAEGDWQWNALGVPLGGLAAICVIVTIWPIAAESSIEKKATSI